MWLYPGLDILVTGFGKLEHTPLPDVSFFSPLGGNAVPVVLGFIPWQIPHFDIRYTSKRRQSDFKYDSFIIGYNYEKIMLQKLI